MLASDLVKELQALIEREGDLPVRLDTNPFELVDIEYVDTDCEVDVIIIAAKELGEPS